MLPKNKNSNSFFFERFTTKMLRFFQGEFSNDTETKNVPIARLSPSEQKSEDRQNFKSSNFTGLNIAKNRTESLGPMIMSVLASRPFDRRSSGQRPDDLRPVSKTSATRTSLNGNRGLRSSEASKQQVVSITYEEIGLFPRSFNRVFDRFFKQLFFEVDNLVIQEYRFYRYLFLTTVKCVFILLFVPLTINFVAKNYLVRPITEYYWNTNQSEIFLNSYQQKKAFTELQEFEEKIYFESLILVAPPQGNMLTEDLSGQRPEQAVSQTKKNNGLSVSNISKFDSKSQLEIPLAESLPIFFSFSTFRPEVGGRNEGQNRQLKFRSNEPDSLLSNDHREFSNLSSSLKRQNVYSVELFSESVQNQLHEKILDLAIHYNEESIESITNFFADLISFSTLCYLFFVLEIQINITKSFLLEVFFGLDDSKKSLFILFLTDLLVGYHSPNIWELFFSSLFDHYGLPESQTTIFLLVATLPVLLDVLFKYLIFRHLNRASPATVATYHAMIE